MMDSVPVDSDAETGLTTAGAIVRGAMAVDAACEAYWSTMFADGWSWREMRDGLAGNNEHARTLAREHAEEIVAAMTAAIAAYIHARDAKPVSARESAGRENPK